MDNSFPKLRIANTIKKKIEEIPNVICFTIGGTYLQEIDPLWVTKDIDLVLVASEPMANLPNIEETVVSKLQSLDYQHLYNSRDPWQFKSEGEDKTKLDIFIHEVFDFRITESMLNRATRGKLAYEDYVLLKIQTARDSSRDITDITSLLQKIRPKKLKWDVFFKELEFQLFELQQKTNIDVVLGRIYEIGFKLENIWENFPNLIPGSTMKRMENLHNTFDSLKNDK